MADAFVTELAGRAPVRLDEPLHEHTTLKVGGSAAVYVEARTVADVVAVAQTAAAHDRPVLVVGRGSNLLVADAGWPGVVLVAGRGFRGVTFHADEAGAEVVAGAAEPMPILARAVAKEGLAGLAFGIAIPGSLGGAVRMNAGAHGREMRDVLAWVDVCRLSDGGRLERVDAADIAFGYRHTDLPRDAFVVRAGLRLVRADAAEVAAEMEEMRAWRRAHQPINDPSCGSVFRNPDGDSAGRLIDSAGLKGFAVGGARVSEVHANFITVSPGATAADVRAVIQHVRAAVEQHHGVRLETEVVLAGFDDAGDA